MQSLTNHNQNAATKSSTLQQQQKIQIHVHHILRVPSQSLKNWNLRQVPKQTSSIQDPVLSLKGLRPATGLTNSRITHHQNATHNKILSPPLPLTQKKLQSFSDNHMKSLTPCSYRGRLSWTRCGPVRGPAHSGPRSRGPSRTSEWWASTRSRRLDCEVVLLFSFFALCRHTTGRLVAGAWTMRSSRSYASRIICLWKGKRRCWRRWRALDIGLGKGKRREERCGTDAKYGCEIWRDSKFVFFFKLFKDGHYNKTAFV